MRTRKGNWEVEPLRDRIADSLRDDVNGMVGYHLLCLGRYCDSPIELQLGAALLAIDAMNPAGASLGLTLAGSDEIESYNESACLLIPQYPWEGYRIDFALRVPQYRFQRIFIECDGHNFHERTKEQAAKDRGKDRLIQGSGIPILRFTGAEIHATPAGCAAQVYQFLDERIEDWAQ